MITVLTNLRADLCTWSDLNDTIVRITFLNGINKGADELFLFFEYFFCCFSKRSKCEHDIEVLVLFFYQEIGKQLSEQASFVSEIVTSVLAGDS